MSIAAWTRGTESSSHDLQWRGPSKASPRRSSASHRLGASSGATSGREFRKIADGVPHCHTLGRPDGLPAWDRWIGSDPAGEGGMRVHMPTFPNADRGIPKGGGRSHPQPQAPDRHRRSGGRRATARRPATYGSAVAHGESGFPCTCTPLFDVRARIGIDPRHYRSRSAFRRSLSTPVRHSWELIREQSPVS